MLTTKPMKKTRVSKRVKMPQPQEESKVVEEKKEDTSHPTPKIPKRVKPVRRAEVISKKSKDSVPRNNAWVSHIKAYQKEHGCTYKVAMREARATYKKA